MKPAIHDTAAFEMADVLAFRAVQDGKADAMQQVRVIAWVLHRGCRINRLSFQPESERETCFAEGRRFPGLQIMRMLTAPLDDLRKEIESRNPGAKPSEPGEHG